MNKHIHRDSLSKVLRENGLRGVIVTHGFKATLRTIARERLRNKFAPRALCLSPWQDHGVLRLRKQKTARYADFKNTIIMLPVTSHGELQVHPDVLEEQLSHAKKGDAQKAYDRTQFIEERHELMQRWADYIDALKNNEIVVPLFRKTT